MTRMPFTAEYDGHCPSCGRFIEPADRVLYVNDRVLHIECDVEVTA